MIDKKAKSLLKNFALKLVQLARTCFEMLKIIRLEFVCVFNWLSFAILAVGSMENSQNTYNAIVKIVDLVNVEQAGELGSNVRSVGSEEDDREATPKIDQHFAVVRMSEELVGRFSNCLWIARVQQLLSGFV